MGAWGSLAPPRVCQAKQKARLTELPSLPVWGLCPYSPQGPLHLVPTGMGPEPQKTGVLELEELELRIPGGFHAQPRGLGFHSDPEKSCLEQPDEEEAQREGCAGGHQEKQAGTASGAYTLGVTFPPPPGPERLDGGPNLLNWCHLPSWHQFLVSGNWPLCRAWGKFSVFRIPVSTLTLCPSCPPPSTQIPTSRILGTPLPHLYTPGCLKSELNPFPLPLPTLNSWSRLRSHWNSRAAAGPLDLLVPSPGYPSYSIMRGTSNSKFPDPAARAQLPGPCPHPRTPECPRPRVP